MKFFSDITLGQYVERNSPLHRLDAKVKIFLSMLLMVYVMMGKSFMDFLLLSLFLGLIIPLAKLPVTRVLKGIKPIIYLAVFTMILHVLLTPERDQTILFFSYSSQGLKEGTQVCFRLLLLILSATLLTLTTRPLALTLALKKLLTPLQRFGVPAYELSMMMMIALRFIPVIGEETARLVTAQQSRCLDFKSRNMKAKMEVVGNTVTALFVRVFHRADSVAIAMESRGFPGVSDPADLYPGKLDRYDFLACLITVILGALLYLY